MASTDLLCGPSKPDTFNQEDPQPNFDRAMSELTFNEKCKSCSLIKHDPLTCEEADKIFTELSNERDMVESFKALDMLWIIRTCTICPTCGKFYEKNGGCDNMRCEVCGCYFTFIPISKLLQYFKLALNSGRKSNESLEIPTRTGFGKFDNLKNFGNFLLALYGQLRQFTKLRICVDCSEVKLLDKIEMETSKVTGNKYVSRKQWPEKDLNLNYICNNCASKCSDCKQVLRIHWHKKCLNCHENSIQIEPTTTDSRPNLSREKDTYNTSPISDISYSKQDCTKRINFECSSNYKLKKQLDEKKRDISLHRNLSKKYESIALTRAENRAKKAATSKLKAKKKSRSIAHKYS